MPMDAIMAGTNRLSLYEKMFLKKFSHDPEYDFFFGNQRSPESSGQDMSTDDYGFPQLHL